MNLFFSSRHIWWKRPQMRTDANLDIERKTTWLELFWDLIFVAVIAELTQYLQVHQGGDGIWKFGFLFVPVWWIWNGVTFYNERYEANDVRHRLLTFLSMVPITGMAYSLYGAFDQTADFFAVCHLLSRLILIYMWLTAGHSDLEKGLSRLFSVGLGTSSLLFLVSLALAPPYKFWCWAGAIAADLATPFFSTGLQARLPRISRSHLPERFGLLIILTLGETVLSGFKALAGNQPLSLVTGIAAVLSLFVSFLIWWVYTDQVLYRVFKPSIGQAMGWCYLHLPLAAAILVLSVTLQQTVAATLTGMAPFRLADLRWQLALSVAVFLGVVSLIIRVSETRDHQHGLIDFHNRLEKSMLLYRLAGGSLILVAVAVAGKALSPVLLLVTVAVGLLIPAIHGLYVWVKAHLRQHPTLVSNS
jgi:low temperature requirement protein LtrA